MEWQPIETAPQDETRVLVFDPTADYGEYINIDYWGRLFRDENDNNVYGWDGAPTHWMTLPEAPNV